MKNIYFYRFLQFLLYSLIFCVLTLACQGSIVPQSNEILPPTQTDTALSQQKVTPTFKDEYRLNTTPTVKLNPTEVPTEPLPTQPPTPMPSMQVKLLAVGDIMLGRTIGEMIEAEGIEAPFFYTADVLRSADITIGNLECPISTRGEAEDKNYAFRAPLSAAESLAWAGFDIVNLANNHILDYGPVALIDTMGALAQNDLYTVGAGQNASEAYTPALLEINGLKIAFLGFMDVHPGKYNYPSWEASEDKPGVAWAHEEIVQARVTSAKQEADLVIVLIHNGYELVQQISSQQYNIARLAIDSGASLVIGSHPHVLQRIDTYNDGLIVYSMGNFVFDNFLYPPNYSAILSVEFSAQGVVSYELIDVIVQLNGVPQIMPYK